MEEVRLSLYLDLRQGSHADLRIACRAATAFAAAIEEVARAIDPNQSISVELVSGSEGSLGLDTVSRFFVSAQQRIKVGLEQRPVARWVLIYVVFRILNNAVDWSQDQVMDWLVGKDAPPVCATMSPEDRKLLASDIVELMRKNVGSNEVRTIYREVAKDDKIEGVGVAFQPKERPAKLVRREAFNQFSEAPILPNGEVRHRNQRINVTLVSPVLVAGDRRWRFRAATGEFGAPVKDEAFQMQFLSGQSRMPLQAGIEMEIELLVTETFANGDWQVAAREVTQVYGWKDPPQQLDLLATPTNDIEPDKDGK
jgi:hypothetical protein